MTKNERELSESDLKIAEKSIDLLIAISDKLQSLAHSREKLIIDDVRDAVQMAENALRKILL